MLIGKQLTHMHIILRHFVELCGRTQCSVCIVRSCSATNVAMAKPGCNAYRHHKGFQERSSAAIEKRRIILLTAHRMTPDPTMFKGHQRG